MTDWKPQPYRRTAVELGVSTSVLEAAIAASSAVVAVHPSLPPILSLRHLAHLTDVPYAKLRLWAGRDFEGEHPYRVFSIRKRPKKDGAKRFRVICVPEFELASAQRWLAKHVLAHGRPHSASTAFAPGSTLLDAVGAHCGSRWLVKVDVHRFFESVSEIAAYGAFRRLGYQPLVSLELARICTRLPQYGDSTRPNPKRFRRHAPWNKYKIESYWTYGIGHLPQGAPTSPMLANLVMVDLDKKLERLAAAEGMTYTRYADDCTFSSPSPDFQRESAERLIKLVYRAFGQHGLRPNLAKTQVVPPRARKIVLGLLVDQARPRLTRDFKAKMRMHLYFLEHPQIGPLGHAERRGFSAVAGLRNHLLGLAAYASQVEPDYGETLKQRLYAVKWPLLSSV